MGGPTRRCAVPSCGSPRCPGGKHPYDTLCRKHANRVHAGVTYWLPRTERPDPVRLAEELAREQVLGVSRRRSYRLPPAVPSNVPDRQGMQDQIESVVAAARIVVRRAPEHPSVADLAESLRRLDALIQSP